MFSVDTIDNDVFLDMPQTTQLLYFQLGMRADDDGFITPKKVMRMLGSQEDDLKILIAKRYLLAFDSGVVVIKHWPINNYIQKDRHVRTTFTKELATLTRNEFGAYTELSRVSDFAMELAQKTAKKPKKPVVKRTTLSDEKYTTTDRSKNKSRIQNVNKMDTQVRLGKVRVYNTNVLHTGDKSPGSEISKLYYQVIKQLKLPVKNHNNVRKVIEKMEREKIDLENITYLEFMLNNFQTWKHRYKPAINEALDIYGKRNSVLSKFEPARARGVKL